MASPPPVSACGAPASTANDETEDGAGVDARQSRPRELAVGDRIGRFRVEGILGRGGQGVVVHAVDTELGRTVALKLLRSPDVTARARLVREARALAALRHPNVLQVFDVGEHAGLVWLAMEYIDGLDLGRWLAAQPRELRATIRVLIAAARGLAAAHEAQQLHRDFKPANVLVAADGRVVVADFGLARSLDPAGRDASFMTAPNARVGSPAYMAPEQQFGASVDARADQFAFCITLYEAIYGERPLGGRGGFELSGIAQRRLAEPPPGRRRAPRWLDEILRRGFALDPTYRFASMTAIAAALERGLSRRRALGRVAAIVAGGGLIAGVVAIMGSREPPPLAASALGGLPDATMSLLAPESPWDRARIDAALADLTALRERRDYARVAARAQVIRDAALASDDASLAAAALSRYAGAVARLGDGDRSLDLRDRVIAEALAIGNDAMAAREALRCVGSARGVDAARVQAWIRQAETSGGRAGLGAELSSDLETAEAFQACEHSDFAGCLDHGYLALDLDEDESAEERAQIYNNLGRAHLALGQLPLAREAFEAAVDSEASHDGATSIDALNSLLNLGYFETTLGDTEAGLAILRSAVSVAHEVGTPTNIARAELALADAALAIHAYHTCEAAISGALARRDVLDRIARVDAFDSAARCALAIGEPDRARELAAAGLAEAETTEQDPGVVARLEFLYAQTRWASGQRDDALQDATRIMVSGGSADLMYEVARWLITPEVFFPAADPPR